MKKTDFIQQALKMDKGQRTTNIAQATELINNTIKLFKTKSGIDLNEVIKKIK